MANLEHTTSSMLPIQSFLIHMAVMCGYGATERILAKTQQRFSGGSAPLQLSGASQRQRQVTLGRWHRTRDCATSHPPPPLTAFEKARDALGAGGGRVGFRSGSWGAASSESAARVRCGHRGWRRVVVRACVDESVLESLCGLVLAFRACFRAPVSCVSTYMCPAAPPVSSDESYVRD
jgi:hypothetical protein